VLEHREFILEVAERSAVDDHEQAKRAAESVLVGVARRLDDAGRDRLASILPSALAKLVKESTVPPETADLPAFLATVASAADMIPERARYVAMATLSVIGDDDADTASFLRAELPDDFDELFQAPGMGPPPERAASAAMPGPTELTPEEVQRALARLPGWTGDDKRLRRTVRLPPGEDAEIREQIANVEREMNHHSVVEEGPDGTTFVLWTHHRGVVTDLDVELARRISEIIENG
jgi:pterin-4a-carbinolamine dehydratase/uncharacterized protein (DUF2267 family)